MMSQKPCRGSFCHFGKGSIIAELLVAVAMASVFAVIIGTSSSEIKEMYVRSSKSLSKMSEADTFVFGNERKYGNERKELSYEPLSLHKVSQSEETINGNPLCASYFNQNTSPVLNASEDVVSIQNTLIFARQISLPIDPLLPLTDVEVRNGIAYISADSSVYSDPDLLVIDIGQSSEPRLISSINTGPGISAISLVGRHIFAAANSSAYQMHVIRVDDSHNLYLETKLSLKPPNASSTLPSGSAIAYDDGEVILGSSKWDGDELTMIDVSNPSLPSIGGGLKVGSKVTDIRAENGFVFASTAGQKQLMMLKLNKDSGNLEEVWSFSPSGWQRQEGKVSAVFEGGLLAGRTSGGYDIPEDHEVFVWDGSALPPVSSPRSLNVPRGVYGVMSDRARIYLATRKYDSEFVVIEKSPESGFAQKSFSLPIGPEVMTCDGNSIYILAHLAPYIYEIKIKK